MKNKILLFVCLITSTLLIGGCGNRNRKETNLIGKTEIVEKEKTEDLNWLVGIWVGYDSYMNQDCAIVLKANEDGSFLKKGGGYDTVYILGSWYISNNGRLCVSSGQRKIYFDINRESKSLISNSGTIFTKK